MVTESAARRKSLDQADGDEGKNAKADDRHQQALAPGDHFLAREGRHQVGIFGQQGRYAVLQHVGRVTCIRIHKQDQFAGGSLVELVAGPVFSQPAVR